MGWKNTTTSSCDHMFRMKKLTGAVVLLGLMLVLAGVLLVRMEYPTEANREDVAPETTEQTVPTAAEEITPSLVATAEPMLPPTPTPTTSPTPRPLREISLSDESLPEELLRPAEHRGTVEEDDYPTRDMVSDVPDRINKDIMIYLPYGYDPEGQYDVLILLHCAWADHRFWLGQERNYGREDAPIPVSVPNLLDRMIEEGWCKPLIVVSPCIYLYDRQPSNAGNTYDYMQFAKEIGQDLLPWIVENYATYAVDGSREALCEAREHFGVLGASFGAYATYISLIGDNFDLLAWYTFCGGGEIDPGYLIDSWNQAETAELPLRMLYICEGEFDDRAGPELSYNYLLNTGGPFSEENVRFTLVRGWGHEDHSYLVGLYNSLHMFFRENG